MRNVVPHSQTRPSKNPHGSSARGTFGYGFVVKPHSLRPAVPVPSPEEGTKLAGGRPPPRDGQAAKPVEAADQQMLCHVPTMLDLNGLNDVFGRASLYFAGAQVTNGRRQSSQKV